MFVGTALFPHTLWEQLFVTAFYYSCSSNKEKLVYTFLLFSRDYALTFVVLVHILQSLSKAAVELVFSCLCRCSFHTVYTLCKSDLKYLHRQWLHNLTKINFFRFNNSIKQKKLTCWSFGPFFLDALGLFVELVESREELNIKVKRSYRFKCQFIVILYLCIEISVFEQHRE